MTEQEQRIAIAEWCGWVACCEGKVVWRLRGVEGALPDYVNDLHAMAEAERRLNYMPADARSLYVDYLYCALGWGDATTAGEARFEAQWRAICATAAQRAEALLRTLNLWTE